jgi:hypothetical protein
MIILRLATFFILALLLPWVIKDAESVFAEDAAPSIQVPIADFHFGEVREGTVISHDFLIRNSGTAVLEILQVRPG